MPSPSDAVRAMVTSDSLFDPTVVENPHAYFADLRAHDPVHEIPGTGTFLVTRMDLIREIAGNPAVFSSVSGEFLHRDPAGDGPALRSPAPGVDLETSGGAVLATADPPDHTRQRKVVARTLSSSTMQQMEPEFRQLVDGVLDDALALGKIEWMSELAEPLPMIMVARILGLPDTLAPRIKEQGYAAVEAIGGFASDERLEELGLPMMDVGPVVDAFLAARSSGEHDPNTLIGVCAKAVDAGELTEVEAFALLFILVSAGGESTTSLTGTGARILAEDQDLQRRLRRDPELIPAFVEEACRIDPPFRGHYRKATADVELAGVAIPSGSTVVLAWPSANRDADAFTNADEIDLERPNPRHHVGFGWGIHLCVGAPLARLEAKVTFEQLLARTTEFTIDPSSPALHHHQSLMIRRLTRLPLLLKSRS